MSAFRYAPVEELVVAVLLALIAAGLAAVPALRRRQLAAAWLISARVLLGGAVIAVLVVTMSGFGGGVNLIPGAGIVSALNNVNSDLGMLNVFGNVVMFVPVGLLLPLATRLRTGRAVGLCAAFSLVIELLQLLLGRTFDIDDVLLNSLGGWCGAVLGVVLASWVARRAASRGSLVT